MHERKLQHLKMVYLSGFRALELFPCNQGAIPEHAYLNESSTPQINVNSTSSPAREVVPQPDCSRDSEDVLEVRVQILTVLDTISPINNVTKLKQIRKNARVLASILNTQNNRIYYKLEN